MIKLSLTPDLRFANDKLVNRKATITLNDKTFEGTFSIMPASASTQAAITAEAEVSEDVVVEANATKTVELTANVIKTVHFKKGQASVDTGLVLKVDNSGELPVTETFKVVTEGYSVIASPRKTLMISRNNYTEAETAEVELKDVPVATGRLVGNATSFTIKGVGTVRIHALCNWVGHTGLKENLESFKMVTKDHEELVLTLATKHQEPEAS